MGIKLHRYASFIFHTHITNRIDFFSIHANVCAQKSLKCTCPGLDPVTPLM